MSLRTHIHHGWAELVLADPPRNVLHADLLRGLAETLVELAAEAPVLLLRSQGRHFSTGYPIGDIPEEIFHEDAEVRAATPFETVMQRLVDYPAPVIMAVQGDAWGGAVEMLACADLRVAAAGVRVALTPARLGLIYSHTGLRRLGRALGSPLLREMVLTGLPVTTDRLERTGFFSRVVTAEDLESCTGEMVDAVLCGGPQALRGTRHVLRILEETENLAQEELAKIARLRHRSRLSAEFNDAQAAFLEGRPSPFRKGE
ncbi:hypothetical protein GW813_03080 [bacterium]|nr:hypothetical protein [bacterium]PJA76315.1 MAG: hypothetical protein CO151_03130 [bacterium CG_4_9_14_3_um_filter_65_15]